MMEKRNYLLIGMNFLNYNFAIAEKEYKTNNMIRWQLAGKPIYSKKWNSYKIDSKAQMSKIVRLGDIIYFYVFGIPSDGGNDKARILLRGEVVEAPRPMKYNEVYINDTSEHMINGFSIGKITTLNKEQLENDMCYSRKVLLKEYNQITPQGLTNWPNRFIGNLNESLIFDLENSFKKSGDKRDFAALVNHFNRECFFKGKLGATTQHLTFKRRNGTDYYEGHHFIQQYMGNKIEALDKIIKNDSNLLKLCSNCHNCLHYGQIEQVEKMIQIIWENQEIQTLLQKNKFQEIINVGSDEEALDWVKSVYKINNSIHKGKDII